MPDFSQAPLSTLLNQASFPALLLITLHEPMAKVYEVNLAKSPTLEVLSQSLSIPPSPYSLVRHSPLVLVEFAAELHSIGKSLFPTVSVSE